MTIRGRLRIWRSRSLLNLVLISFIFVTGWSQLSQAQNKTPGQAPPPLSADDLSDIEKKIDEPKSLQPAKPVQKTRKIKNQAGPSQSATTEVARPKATLPQTQTQPFKAPTAVPTSPQSNSMKIRPLVKSKKIEKPAPSTQPNAAPPSAPPVAGPATSDYAAGTEIKDMPKSKWQEVYSIIDEIKESNVPHNLRLMLRTGPIEMQTNTSNAVLLGNNSLMALGLDAALAVAGPIGIDFHYLYGKNLFPDANSPNDSGAWMSWLDLGPSYTINLDSSRLDDFITFKLLYHQNDSNFQLISQALSTDPLIFMTHYAGVSGGIERSIPITKRLGVLASFNLIQILQASTPSTLLFQQSGYGFEVLGQVYYQIQAFSRPLRIGISYWQQGNSNEFIEEAANQDNKFKTKTSRNSYFQLSRALFASVSFMF